MLTDTKTNNLRIVLHQIWANLYVEFVVKNPLAPAEHAGGVGVANELFELGLESFMVRFFSVNLILLLLVPCACTVLHVILASSLYSIVK